MSKKPTPRRRKPADRVAHVTFEGPGRGNEYAYILPGNLEAEAGDRAIVLSPYNGITIVTIHSVTPKRSMSLATKPILGVISYAPYRELKTAEQERKKLEAELDKLLKAEVVHDKYRVIADHPSAKPLLAKLKKLS